PSCFTLFPYTTLFRSNLILREVALDLDRQRHFLELARERALVREEQIARELLRDGAAAFDGAPAQHVLNRRARHAPHVNAPVMIDRKSTRLNSSHQII